MKSEKRIQQDIVVHYRNTYCLAHHVPRSLIISIPNEGLPRLAQTGLYAGVSDLIVFHCTAGNPMRVLFVEVKMETGKLSPKQVAFGAMILAMKGDMSYHVVRSLEDFKKIIA